jgi:hypothetical protein
MVRSTCPEGSTWTKGWCLNGPGHPTHLACAANGQNPRVFLWAKAKETWGCLTATHLLGGQDNPLGRPSWPTERGVEVCGVTPKPSRCPLSPLLRPLQHLGEALQEFLHHRHDAIVLPIPSTSPPYLLNQ